MIWLATNAGLHRLDPATGTVEHFRHAADRPDSLSTDDINWTGEDRSGLFWVGNRNGLDQFDRQTSSDSGGFAFAFVEGNIIKAARNGDWVLLVRCRSESRNPYAELLC